MSERASMPVSEWAKTRQRITQHSPTDLQKRPVALLSPGFLVDSASYRSYCKQLATWGMVAVRYDLSEFRDDVANVVAMRWVWKCGG